MPSLLSLAHMPRGVKYTTPSTHTPSKSSDIKKLLPSFLMSKLSSPHHQIPTIPNKTISIAEKARQGAYSQPKIKLPSTKIKIPLITIQKRFYHDSKTTNKPREACLIGEKAKPTTADFMSFIKDDGLLVDKSLSIEEFWQGSACQLVVRPRRFGKTSLMSLMQCFFAEEVDGIKTKGMFDKFAIAKVNNGEFMRQHQGKYPVIFISFKDIKERNYENAISKFRLTIQDLYRQHKYLLNVPKIDQDDKNLFHLYLIGSANEEELASSLKVLSQLLHKAHDGQGAIILIDEYDAPLTTAYENKFSEELGGFMRNMFSAALKDNRYVQKSLMTGVLRVSQSSMLTGLNNLVTYTVLDPKYQRAFGFEETEVEALLTKTKVMTPGDSATFAGVKAIYNGYRVGNTILYNPWSIMQLVSQGELKPYWVLTANDVLLKKVLIHSSEETKAKLAQLMLGKTVECLIDTNLRYEDLMEKPETIWTLLLFGGYLTVENQGVRKSLAEQVAQFNQMGTVSTKINCQVRIPNREIAAQYDDIFADWMKESIGADKYDYFLRNLIEGKIKTFETDLQDYIIDVLSVRDIGGEKEQPERFYHGLMVGLIASLKQDFNIHSNKEGGTGFYDLALVPKSKSPGKPIIIMECKRSLSLDSLEEDAIKAVRQIEVKQYTKAFLRDYEGKDLTQIKVIILDLAFWSKSVKSSDKVVSLAEILNTPESL